MLVSETDKVYKIALCVFKFVLTVFAATCAYAAIRMDGVLAPVCALIGSTDTALLVVFLYCIGLVHTESSSILDMFAKLPTKGEARGMRKWLRRSLRSLRPMKMHIMSFYSIEMICTPIVLRIIAENVIFMLVNY